MNIKFSTIRYWHLQDGNVNILFDSTEETKLFLFLPTTQAYDYFSTRIDKQVDGNLPAF